MNEEEKKAMVRIVDTFYSDSDLEKIILYKDSIRDVRILLNLIEKLQKENEKLKEVRKWYFENTINKICSPEMLNKILRDDYISKKEVKDKIEKEIKYHEKNILDIENIKEKTIKEEAEIEFNKYAIVVLSKMLNELIKERKWIMDEIKKKLKEISEDLRSIKWDFKIANDYLAETEDMIANIQNKQETNTIKDISNFKRELEREGLYSNKLDEFIEGYMRYYNN